MRIKLCLNVVTLILLYLAIFPEAGRAARSETFFYTIQIASFRQHQLAIEAAKKMKETHRMVFYRSKQVAGKGVWYRLYINRYATIQAAQAGLTQLRHQGIISDAWVRRVKEIAPDPADKSPEDNQVVPIKSKPALANSKPGSGYHPHDTPAHDGSHSKVAHDQVTIKDITYRIDGDHGDTAYIHGDRFFWPSLRLSHQGDNPTLQVTVHNIKNLEKDIIEVIKHGKFIKTSQTNFDYRNDTLLINLKIPADGSYTMTQFFNKADNVFSVAIGEEF
jgi:sporulation related protein